MKAKCIDNTYYPVSLEVGNVYIVEPMGEFYYSVRDETGGEYIFSRRHFEEVKDDG